MIALTLGAFTLSLLLTLAAERVARRTGVVARPVADRWHRQTVPLLGGAAIVVATVVPILAIAPRNQNLVVLALTACAMGAVGLIDDVRRLSPQTRLLAQLLLATVLLAFGFALRLTDWILLDVFLTLVWIVGITNAFNLLDNMDGLAATIALVATAFRLVFFHWESDTAGALAAVSFLGAVAGFLVRNFPPARVFMGDAGSLFIGFFLAGLSISAPRASYSRGVFAVLVIPVLLLLIPIFDTAFVTITRLLGGRSPAVGGRDHTSHRLVAVGLSERGAVLLMGGISAAGGVVAMLSYRTGLTYTVGLLALLVIALVLLGIHLSRVRVVGPEVDVSRTTMLRLLADFQFKRQAFTLLLDATLIPLAYYAAYLLRFEDELGVQLSRFYTSLPVVLVAELVALSAFGLYRGVWQYMSSADVVRLVKATTTGTTAAVVALTYLTRFEGFSRTVFVLDWVLLTGLVLGSRASFRIFAELFRGKPSSFARVLIYGAGHGGELVARELLNNPAHHRVPVGFLDDDRGKHQASIHGLPVLGSIDHLEAAVRAYGVAELILSSEKIAEDGLSHAHNVCEQLGLTLCRLSFRLDRAAGRTSGL